MFSVFMDAKRERVEKYKISEPYVHVQTGSGIIKPPAVLKCADSQFLAKKLPGPGSHFLPQGNPIQICWLLNSLKSHSRVRLGSVRNKELSTPLQFERCLAPELISMVFCQNLHYNIICTLKPNQDINSLDEAH